MGRKRVTQNNSRVSKKNGKAFFAKHLDGPDGKAAKMDGLLKVWRRGVGTWAKGEPMETDPAKMCEGVEAAFYDKYLTPHLSAQNAKHDKSRHKERKKTMDEYRRHPDTCPESTLYMVGKMGNTASPDELWGVFVEFWNWRKQAYPNVVSLDAALHQEQGAPHVHERHVWIAHDKEGQVIVSQTKALEEMGVPRPDEAKYQADMAAARKIKDKDERKKAMKQAALHNNPKMTYTADCREKLIGIAKAHGFEIIETPQEPGEYGLSQARYKARDEERKRDAALKEATELVEAVLVEQDKRAALKQEQERLEHEIGDMKEYQVWKAEKEAQAALWQASAQMAQEDAQEPQDAQENAGEVQVAVPARGAQERPYEAAKAFVRAASMERMIQDVRGSFREEMDRMIQNGLERE